MKKEFRCSSCGHTLNKWQGKCPSCSDWNSIFIFNDNTSTNNFESKLKIPDKKYIHYELSKIKTSFSAFDKTLGGGIVKGSLVLLTGDPGAGKSTLISQAVCDLKKKVFYFSGEETSGQILERFKRLNLNHDNIDIFHERNISTIGKYLYKYKPDIVIIDSIQTSQFGEDLKPGSVNTIKEVVNELLVFSKSLNISIIIIGHVTKGGDFSGPKLLEHMVDIYLTLTLDKKYGTKKLVAEKNRFGLVGNPAFFSMTERGLVKAPFPGEYVFEKSELLPRGSVLSFFSFGPRYGTFLVNVMLYEQFEKIGKRVVENFNLNRLHSICAQAESVFKINLKKYDIFVELPDIIDKNQRQVEVGVVVGILGCYFKKQFMNTDIFYGQTTLSNRVVENNHQNEISKCIKEGDKIFGPSEKIEPFRISNIKDLKTVFEV